MERLLIENVILEGRKVDILSENGTIVRIAPKVEVTGECNRLDGKGMTVLPGFINMHTHAAMTLMRGIKEDVPLYDWLTYIWSVEERLDDDLIYWGAKLACLEMIKSGTTTFMDMYWRIPWACKATEEMGLRSVQSIVMLDHFDKEKSIADREECQQMYELSKSWNKSLTSFAVSIHADYTNSKENILWSAEFARKHGLKIHLHVAETEKEVKDAYQNYGMSPVAYHDSLGVWGPDVVAAHAVWLSDEDVQILGKNHVNVVHNPHSNLKLSSGYRFLYEELRNAGANVTLGTDGAASNNNLDMLESAKTMALMQKAWRFKPESLPIPELMDVMSYNGAKALGINAGKIEEGRLADLILINKNSSCFIPDIDFKGNLIYASNSSCIDTLICNGKVLMNGRKVAGEEEILQNAAKAAARLLKQ